MPFSRTETFADVPKQLMMPVILVVGMKLGCINHALLTAEAIFRDGLPFAGWVANQIDPNMNCYAENVATLKTMLHAPFLGEVPFLQDISPAVVAEFIDISDLLA